MYSKENFNVYISNVQAVKNKSSSLKAIVNSLNIDVGIIVER